MNRSWVRAIALASTVVAIAAFVGPRGAVGQGSPSNEECLMCHSDESLESSDGKSMYVGPGHYEQSVHGMFACTDCHTQDGSYFDIPHFDVYRPVDCSGCHPGAMESYEGSWHDQAKNRNNPNAPECYDCHGIGGDPHRMVSLEQRQVKENACRRCHTKETDAYDGSVHQVAADRGKNSPSCTSCHATHAEARPPSVGAVNRLCEDCHPGAMEQVWMGDHAEVSEELQGVMSCASCHDVHATHRPEAGLDILDACAACHPGYQEQFAGSVHEEMIEGGMMNCLSCHRSHQVTDAVEAEEFGCGQCHVDVEEEYRDSAHRLARLAGEDVAATCGDCHGGHHVLSSEDEESMVYHANIPETCGTCHTDASVITSDYVHLPISLPSYEKSVHGRGLEEGKYTATCTDCHGTHDLTSASDPESDVNKQNIARTCGQCHDKESENYLQSVHAKAVAHGINDSPSCTDCHDEHLIMETESEESPVNRSKQATMGCAQCHEDPEMAARYGLPQGVIASYQDSYHGWAVRHGGEAVATCEDCHNTHNIRSHLDPESSVHPSNVVETCARCHPNSNEQFARSYSHLAAADRMMVHDYIRIIWTWLIILVLGGMAVHNAIIMFHELKQHYRKHKGKPAYVRMTTSEVWQHVALAVSFIGLAITGFALPYPDAFWVKALNFIGMNEEVRALLHRIFAVVLIVASLYHIWFMIFTRRGRKLLVNMAPRPRDVVEAGENVGYYAGLSKKHPSFGMFDYTQKAEYWALIWGTIVMGLSGLVLWFPVFSTSFMPAWVVRVAETLHFYEAILAVGAILIWHFFFTIFLPKEYPMSWIWITGRMEKEQWEAHHAKEKDDTGSYPPESPPETDK